MEQAALRARVEGQALNQDLPMGGQSIFVVLEEAVDLRKAFQQAETEGAVVVAARLRRRRADLLELALRRV